MLGFEHLCYAKVIAQLNDVEQSLEQAASNAAEARDNELFSKLHAKRMEVWDLIKEVMVKGASQ